MIIGSVERIEILENRIRYALSLIEGGHMDEAAMELARALGDPDMQIGSELFTHASDCATHNAPALPIGACDCK